MARALLIAEKNSVRNAVDTYIKKHGFKDRVDCFAAQGHLIRMQEPNEYCEEWNGKWNMNVLPMVPENLEFRFEVTKDAGARKKYDDIVKAIHNNSYDYLINACDSDREGEAIFWYIYNHMKCTLPVKRYWENGLTDESIGHALKTLRDYGDNKTPNLVNLRTASFLRGEFDWLVGMNFTRAASLAMGSVVKLGRVKTPVLWILVDLEKRIKNFKQKTDYRVFSMYPDDTSYEFKHVAESEKGTYAAVIYEDRNEAEEKIKELKMISSGIVKSVESKNRKTKPGKLFTLSDIQVDASKYFNMSVAESSAIMQALYEAKITTYPRTKNPYLSTSETTAFPKMLEACKNIPSLRKYAELILQDKSAIEKVKKNTRYVNDKVTAQEGHCAIVLTGQAFDYDSLSSDQQTLLELVAKRFLAIFLPDMEEKETTCIVEYGNDLFRTITSKTLNMGFMELYNTKEKEPKEISLKKGDSIKFNEFQIGEVISTPPKRMSDGALIAAMRSPAKYLHEQNVKMKEILKETDGIGTEATRKEIIPQLIADKYIEMKGKGNLLYPTELGMAIIENLGEMDITAVDLTAVWETKLEEIKLGKLSEEAFKKEMLKFVEDNVEVFKTRKYHRLNSGNTESKTIGICPACGGNVYSNKNAYFCENFKGKNEGCQFVLKKELLGGKISEANMKKIINGEATDAISMKMQKDGKLIQTKKKLIYNPNTKKIEFYRTEAKKVGICPRCGGELIETDKYVMCRNFTKEDKCPVIFKKDFMGAKLSTEEILGLFNGDNSETHKFKKKDGQKFEARVHYNIKDNKISFVRDSSGTCPCCGGEINGPFNGKYGDFYACSNRCGLIISKVIGGHTLTAKELSRLLNGEKLESVNMTGKEGKSYKASLYIDTANKKVEREFVNNAKTSFQ